MSNIYSVLRDIYGIPTVHPHHLERRHQQSTKPTDILVWSDLSSGRGQRIDMKTEGGKGSETEYQGEELSGQRAHPVQRPWGRTVPALLDEQQGGLCGWSRASEAERGRR